MKRILHLQRKNGNIIFSKNDEAVCSTQLYFRVEFEQAQMVIMLGDVFFHLRHFDELFREATVSEL